MTEYSLLNDCVTQDYFEDFHLIIDYSFLLKYLYMYCVLSSFILADSTMKEISSIYSVSRSYFSRVGIPRRRTKTDHEHRETTKSICMCFVIVVFLLIIIVCLLAIYDYSRQKLHTVATAITVTTEQYTFSKPKVLSMNST